MVRVRKRTRRFLATISAIRSIVRGAEKIVRERYILYGCEVRYKVDISGTTERGITGNAVVCQRHTYGTTIGKETAKVRIGLVDYKSPSWYNP
jgi:hypothetical protein